MAGREQDKGGEEVKLTTSVKVLPLLTKYANVNAALLISALKRCCLQE